MRVPCLPWSLQGTGFLRPARASDAKVARSPGQAKTFRSGKETPADQGPLSRSSCKAEGREGRNPGAPEGPQNLLTHPPEPATNTQFQAKQGLGQFDDENYSVVSEGESVEGVLQDVTQLADQASDPCPDEDILHVVPVQGRRIFRKTRPMETSYADVRPRGSKIEWANRKRKNKEILRADMRARKAARLTATSTMAKNIGLVNSLRTREKGSWPSRGLRLGVR